MSDPLFVTQQRLEGGIERGDITFDDNVLTIVAEGRSYEMAPAVRVLSLLDGEDVAGLLGKVWTIRELTERGGEHFQDSLILGDTAYQCEEGFVAAVALSSAGQTAAAAPAQQMAHAAAESPATPVARSAPVPAPPPAARQAQRAAPAAVATSVAPSASPTRPIPVPAPAPPSIAAPAQPAPPASEEETTADDMALLTDFLLKNL